MLTPAQQMTLKTDITSGGNAAALGALITAEDWPSVANFYNAPSGSTVWRPALKYGRYSAGIACAMRCTSWSWSLPI